jgi:hypothetical protein
MKNREQRPLPKIHPAVFLSILLLIFLTPSIAIAVSGGSVPLPQLPERSFPIMRR